MKEGKLKVQELRKFFLGYKESKEKRSKVSGELQKLEERYGRVEEQLEKSKILMSLLELYAKSGLWSKYCDIFVKHYENMSKEETMSVEMFAKLVREYVELTERLPESDVEMTKLKNTGFEIFSFLFTDDENTYNFVLHKCNPKIGI